MKKYALVIGGGAFGTSIASVLSNNFEKLDLKLPDKINEKIIELAAFLNRNPDLNARIVGFSSKNKHSNKWYNIKLSRLRAERMKNELTKRGVFSFRLVTDGQGFSNPIADNSTEEGRAENRRIVIIDKSNFIQKRWRKS